MCWRLTHLLLNEDGPFSIFYKLRTALGVDEEGGYTYKITVCHNCLSMWVAILSVIVTLYVPVVALVFAVGSVSIIINRIYDRWL